MAVIPAADIRPKWLWLSEAMRSEMAMMAA